MYFGADRFYDGLFPEYQKDLKDWVYSEMLAFLKGLSNTKSEPKQSDYYKKQNAAPKMIEGKYELTIYDKTITLTNKERNIEVEVMCHPDDAFDIASGMKVAFDRYKEQLIQKENAKKPKQAKVRRKLYVGNLVMVKKNTWVHDDEQYVKTPQDIVGYITRMYTVGGSTLCEIQSTDRKYEFTADVTSVELIEQ